MEKSENIKELAKAIITFHSKVNKIKKDAKNPFFKSNYATLSNILESIEIPLTESGLAFTQFPDGENGLTTMLIHAESGEFMQSTYNMKPVKDDPQGRGSAITYQRRYALAAILGLNIDDDDDANTATHGAKAPKAVTSYNHKAIEKDGKPLVTNEQFKKIIERIDAGEIGVYEKAVDLYSFELNQKRALDTAFEKSKLQFT